MSSLSNIRNRLRSVGNIKQIATSMEMVASARFRKAHDKAKQAQFYIAKMQEILEKISGASPDFIHPLLKERSGKKIGVVVVTSDRGLCGAYNANILSAADKFLKDKEPENVELILLGRKAIQYYHQKKWTIRSEHCGGGKIQLQQIKELSDQLVKSFFPGRLDSIWLIYTKFYNLMQREVILEKFLPIGKLKGTNSAGLSYLFEPNIEELYEQILPRYCMTKIETMLYEAHASELAARIFSMKAAAKNAEEMIEQLTLERNKVRQAGITRELLETTSFITE
jgi:F-type H+-transporting ATPase subunit gamma